MQGGQIALQRVPRPFGHRFHRSVGPVEDLSDQPLGPGGLGGVPAKADPLDPSSDDCAEGLVGAVRAPHGLEAGTAVRRERRQSRGKPAWTLQEAPGTPREATISQD